MVGRFDLQGGVVDAVFGAQQVSGLIENAVAVRDVPLDEVRGGNVHAGRQRPQVQVMHGLDAVDPH